MNEEILKDDPLKKPKKITVAFVVFLLALIMVFTFASFHWICADYFNFKAIEGDARKDLEDIRARCTEEVSAAKERLLDVEAKARASEEEAQKRIQAADQIAKDRIAILEKECSDMRDAKLAEHKKSMGELDESLKARKGDIAALLLGYKERFDNKTNDFELAIAEKKAELTELKSAISQLPDVKNQLDAAMAALSDARTQRDSALKRERLAQETYGQWNAKSEAAKAQMGELENRKRSLVKDLETLTRNTNVVHLTTVSLQSQIKTLQTKIDVKQTELQTVQGDIENNKAKLDGVLRQIEEAEEKRRTAEKVREAAVTEMNAALDKKREAESARDTALTQAAQANDDFTKRKLEIDKLKKEMEAILSAKAESAKAENAKNEEGVN